MNVGTIGHVDHGKTTLTAAITKVLSEKGFAKFLAYEDIDKSPEERKRGITISASHVEYETEKRHYAHIDCPGHQNYVKNMITGAAQMDTAILVCSAPEGAQEQTREHLLLSREVGIPNIVCFVNKCDVEKDEGVQEMVEEEIRGILKKYSYDPSKVHFVRGSALLALKETPEAETELGRKSVMRLLNTIDTKVPDPARPLDKPFLMAIEGIFSMTGRGTVVTGRIEQGQIKVGDEVAIIGPKPFPKIVVTGLEMFKKSMDSARAGDNVGCLLRNLKKEDLRRGEVLCKPGTVTPHKKFMCKVYVLTGEEGGRTKPFGTNYAPQFFLRTANITGTVTLPKDKLAMPGDNVEMEVELIHPCAMHEGMRFAVREGTSTVAAGVISKILA